MWFEEEDVANNHENARDRMRHTNRSVANVVGARFARPDDYDTSQEGKVGTVSNAGSNSSKILQHSSKAAVSSTPFGNASRIIRDSIAGDEDMEEDGWCGPFSVARRMIQNREAAKRKLEEKRLENGMGEVLEEGSIQYHHPLDQMIQSLEEEKDKKKHPSKAWTAIASDDSGRYNYYVKRQRRSRNTTLSTSTVKSLFQLSCDFIIENIECLEALGDVDTSIRKALSDKLIEQNKMDDFALKLIAEPGIEVLDIIDCAHITEHKMSNVLQSLIPSGVKAILLNHCGRCFTSKTIDTVVKAYSLHPGEIFAISIGGAYNISDTDAAKLLEAMSASLTSIEFKACMQLGEHFCKALADNYDGSLVELALEDIPLTKTQLTYFINSNCLKGLRNLRLTQIDSVDDDIMRLILLQCGSSLEGLHLSQQENLTDKTLSNIRFFNSGNTLRSLHLSGLPNLTAAGLEALFIPDIEDLPNPPLLRTLDLSENKSTAVTDNVISLAAKASLMNYNGGLVYLNINGASHVTDKALEELATSCSHSLMELDASFCHAIKDSGLGYLISKVHDQLETLHLWGCAQITEKLLDGHARSINSNSDRAPLNIIGTWMKKSA